MTTLEAHNITFAYPGGNPILTTWSHTFTAGQTTAITGPSGCGKSTALYILGLLLTPTTGHVTLNGQTLSNRPDHTRSWHRAHHFGFVFQNAELDPPAPSQTTSSNPATIATKTPPPATTMHSTSWNATA